MKNILTLEQYNVLTKLIDEDSLYEMSTHEDLEVLKDMDILDKIRFYKGNIDDFIKYWTKRIND